MISGNEVCQAHPQNQISNYAMERIDPAEFIHILKKYKYRPHGDSSDATLDFIFVNVKTEWKKTTQRF